MNNEMQFVQNHFWVIIHKHFCEFGDNKVINKLRSMLSETGRVANMLPMAYAKSLGLDYLEIEDPESDGDWLGLADPLPLAEIKKFEPSSGKFVLLYVVIDEDRVVTKKSSNMQITKTDNGYTFSHQEESVTVKSPVTEDSLLPVIQMATRI